MAVNKNNIMSEINNINNWRKTRKKSYEVYMSMPKAGTKVHNKLENASYITDDNKRFVISGTVGEKWVVDFAKLWSTYRNMEGGYLQPSYLRSKIKYGVIDWMKIKTAQGDNAAVNWAFHLPLSIKNFPVKTSWGDTLYANRPGIDHGMGDFLVCADDNGRPNLNDVWIVNGEVFAYTYDMRAFPNMMGKINSVETPLPKSIVRKEDIEKGDLENFSIDDVLALSNYDELYGQMHYSKQLIWMKANYSKLSTADRQRLKPLVEKMAYSFKDTYLDAGEASVVRNNAYSAAQELKRILQEQ